MNNSGPSKWKNSTIPSSKAQYTLPLYEEEKVLKNLEQNTTYVVRLSARNAFGQTEWTERFRFTTSDGEWSHDYNAFSDWSGLLLRSVRHGSVYEGGLCGNVRVLEADTIVRTVDRTPFP